jgi:hypothetical protein
MRLLPTLEGERFRCQVGLRQIPSGFFAALHHRASNGLLFRHHPPLSRVANFAKRVVYDGSMKYKPLPSESQREVEENHHGLRDGARQSVGPGKPSSGPRRPPGAPYWIPADSGWGVLPSGVKQAVVEILQPAYRRMVLEARDELERSAGLTLVHLMWLEICEQAFLGDMVGDRQSILVVVNDREASVARHLHLVGAKNSAAELLLKIRMVRDALEHLDNRPGMPPSEAVTAVLTAPAAKSPDVAPYRILGPGPDLPSEGCSSTKDPEIGKSPSR